MSPYFVIFLCFISPLHAKGGGGRGGGGGGGGGRGIGSSGSRYPASTGLSGNSYHAPPTYRQSHSYPSSTGLSGNVHRTTYSSSHHTHYHYSPPQQISYGSTYHPVFQGTPPVYVYQYKESGSRFDNLLTGLALYNLGRMSANSHSYDYNNGYRYDPNREYRGSPGETCKFTISKRNGEYEETRIDCRLMSSFIWEAERETKQSTNVVTKNVSVVQTTEGNSTVTVKNTTIVDAREVKGPSITVTEGMNCFMIRVSRDSSILKKKVDCGLLQEYAVRSLRNDNSCVRVLPVMIIILSIFTLIL